MTLKLNRVLAVVRATVALVATCARPDRTAPYPWPYTKHALKLAFCRVPIRFNVIGTYARDWVPEMAIVVHSLMGVAEARQLAVGVPLVRPDHGACAQQTTGVGLKSCATNFPNS